MQLPVGILSVYVGARVVGLGATLLHRDLYDQGALYSATVALASVWSDPTESSLVMSIVESGLQVGHAASFLAAAALCSPQEGGTGAISVIFYLQVAIIVAQLGTEWLDCIMLTSLPQFIGVSFNMEATSVEVVTGVGYLLSIPVAVVGARVADRMLTGSRFDRSTVRKIFFALSIGIPGLCFLLLTYLGTRQVALAAAIYLAGVCFTGLTDSAWPANCLDLAPAFTGFLISLAEFFTAWVWAVCVMLVAYMVPKDTGEQWQSVMYLSGGIMLACLLFYFCFASSQKQPWADPQPKPALTAGPTVHYMQPVLDPGHTLNLNQP
ncbi:hypothetical protein ACOMHN_044773 [Nucella lapillus]